MLIPLTLANLACPSDDLPSCMTKIVNSKSPWGEYNGSVDQGVILELKNCWFKFEIQPCFPRLLLTFG